MSSRDSTLDDPLTRRLVLASVCEGGGLKMAAKRAEVSRRSIRRYADKHPIFAARIAQARVLASTGDADAVEALLDLECRTEHVEHNPPDPVPVDVIEAEVVGLAGSVSPAQAAPGQAVKLPVEAVNDPDDPDLLVAGLPALTERNILAFHWAVMHDPDQPAGLRSTCARALHEHVIIRVRQARLAQLRMAQAQQGRAHQGQRQRGLTRETILGVRKAIIGPPPTEEPDAEPAT